MSDLPKIKKNGRPSKYSRSIAKEICDSIATSSKGIKRLCKENTHWPSPDTIYRWLISRGEFSDSYAQAKKYQVEVLVDEIIELADDNTNDEIVTEDGKVIINKDHINRSKLRIDSRKWMAGKLVPRLYGNKGAGECKDCAIKDQLSSLSDEELMQQARIILNN